LERQPGYRGAGAANADGAVAGADEILGVALKPVEFRTFTEKASGKAPDYGHGRLRRASVAWKRTSQDWNGYLWVRLDVPFFGAAIDAAWS
jgi:uncharacterized protein (DUF736 family)